MTDIPRDRWRRPLIIPPHGGDPEPYTRPSTLGRALTDDTTLSRWKQRQTALGLAKRPDLLTAVASKRDDRAELDRLCELAMQAVGSDAGATMGTALHSLSEAVDRGEPLGEEVPPAALERLRLYWRATRQAKLTPRLVEEFVVCDYLRCAGTLDRLYLTRRGTVLVGDLKTGMSYVNGRGLIWPSSAIETAVQMAVYANSTRYDPLTGKRAPLWQDAVTSFDRNWGAIVHLPALSGPCSIFAVDLDEGWRLACRAANTLADRRDAGRLTRSLLVTT